MGCADMPVILRLGRDSLTATGTLKGVQEAGRRGHVRVEGSDARLADQLASRIDQARPRLVSDVDSWTESPW